MPRRPEPIAAQHAPAPKVCSRCKIAKSIEAFARDAAKSCGLQPRCRACVAIADRLRYAANGDRMRAATKAYRAAHPAYGSAWYQANRATACASGRARYRSNPEPVRTNGATWRKANPNLVRAYSANRRALKLGAFVESVDITVLFDRDRGICGICHGPVAESERSIDHVAPLSRGGDHSYANTQLAHRRCNSSKGNR